MGWKQLVCLILLLQIKIANTAAVKKNTHSLSTSTPHPVTEVDSDYYVEDATELSTDQGKKISTINSDTKTIKTSAENIIKNSNTFEMTTHRAVKDTPTKMVDKNTIKPRYLTTKKSSLGSMNSHGKMIEGPKTPSQNDNNETYNDDYEYDNDEKILLTTKYEKPTTNKYLSAKGTTTVTPLNKSKQNTKLQAQIAPTSIEDSSMDVLMPGSRVQTKTTPIKKSSDLNTDISQPDKLSMNNYYSDPSLYKKTTNAITNRVTENQESHSDEYYYYEDDISTSPTTTNKQSDETSRSIFKPIGSQITAAKSTIKISLLPTTKLPVATSQRTPSVDTEYYYQDNIDSTTKKPILIPQPKNNIDDKPTTTKTTTTEKPTTLPSGSISWHGNHKIITSGHIYEKKPVSSQEDYLTESDENMSGEDNGQHSIHLKGNFLPGNEFQPIQISGPRQQEGTVFQPNLKQGQFYPGIGNPQLFPSLNSPHHINFMGGQKSFIGPDSSSMFKNNDQATRASPFDDDSDNLSSEISVSTNKNKLLKQNNLNLDEKNHTEKKLNQNLHNSKSDQFNDEYIDTKKISDPSDNVKPKNLQEISSSSNLQSKGNGKTLSGQINQKTKISPQLNNTESESYNITSRPTIQLLKNTMKTQGDNTDIKNGNTANSQRQDSLPLCRTKSGYLKRNAYVLNCKNETVQLQSAYQPWNSKESAFKITLCSFDANTHDKRIIATHPELKDSVNNFQCEKAKGTCIQKFTELIAMIHTDTGALWDCIQIPLGCACDISQQ